MNLPKISYLLTMLFASNPALAHTGEDVYMHHQMWGGAWFGSLFMVLFGVLLVLAIIYLAQRIAQEKGEEK